jgi:phosphate ABC transporter permease protein PstC
MNQNQKKRIKEVFIEKSLLLIACSAVGILLLIALFIFREGLPVLFKYGLKKFIGTNDWAPLKGHFGILAMILGSLWVTLGSLVIGVPLGLGCAIFLTEFVPAKVRRVLKPTIELLAGIPSVVYGFIGVIILVPFIRNVFGGPGLSVAAAAIVLAIMILPTIISISIDAILAVPKTYREGSLALGATRWQTVTGVVLIAARSGIVASIILGMGRAIGETMAVIMVAGNTVQSPHSILAPVRTLTANIALEMGFAAGDHRSALFATGVVLFVFVMTLNIIASRAVKRK